MQFLYNFSCIESLDHKLQGLTLRGRKLRNHLIYDSLQLFMKYSRFG